MAQPCSRDEITTALSTQHRMEHLEMEVSMRNHHTSPLPASLVGSLGGPGGRGKTRRASSLRCPSRDPSPQSASCIINFASILISFSHFIMRLLKMGEKKVSGADKMVTEPTTKPESLNLIYGTHTMEGKNQSLRVVLCPPHAHCGICTHRKTQHTCMHVPFSTRTLWHMHTHRDTGHMPAQAFFCMHTVTYAYTHTDTTHTPARAFSFKEGKSLYTLKALPAECAFMFPELCPSLTLQIETLNDLEGVDSHYTREHLVHNVSCFGAAPENT